MKNISIIAIILFFVSCSVDKKDDNREAGKSFDAYGPAENLQERWSYPEAYYSEQKYDEVMAQVKAQMAQKDGDDVSWRIEGPLNIGGRINCIALNPDNESEILIGTASGGAFKSTDEGLNWIAIGENFTSMSIGAIAYDPQNSNVIYVGTGDPNISGTPKTGHGMYKSVDGGINWDYLGPQEVGIVSKILVHPTNSNIVYMASMGTPYFADEHRGIYKSTDAGQSWTQILYLSDEAGISSLVFHPNTPDTLYAAGWDRIRNNQVSINSGDHGRIYRSFDGGENWTELMDDLPQVEMSRAAVDISMTEPITLYASMLDPESYELEGVYISEDYGDSWAIANMNNLSEILGGFGWYFGQIRVNPTDANHVSVLGVELHTTTNGGVSWFQSTPDWQQYIVHADMHDLVFAPSGKVWLATDGGLYLGSSDLDDWEYRSYLPISQFYRITVNPFVAGEYAGGMQDNGTSAGSYQNADNWPRLFGGDGFQCLYDPNNENRFYASTQNGNFYAFDSGNIYDFNFGIPSDERVAWDAPLVMSSNNSSVLYTGTSKVYRIEGIFEGWDPISDDMTGEPVFLGNRYVVTTVDESPLNQEVIYSGTSDGKVWRTQNGGGSWNEITAGLPDRYVTHVKASPSLEGRIYVSHSGYKDGDHAPHIHASDDYGSTWYSIAGDLPEFGINNIEVMEGTQDSVLFIATDGGVYYTINGGENWDRAGNNMPIILVFDVEIDPLNNRLVAGTFSRSMQSIDLDSLLEVTVGIEELEIASTYSLYPNPAIDQIFIKAPEDVEQISWSIYSMDGKLIKSGRRIDQPINIAELKKGTYLFAPENAEAIRFTKILNR